MPAVKGLSTYMVYLMVGTLDSSTQAYTYNKLIDITDFPDLQPEPETIDITSLSDKMRQYIPGIQDPGGNMSFGANYTKENYQAVKALDDGNAHRVGVWIGGTESAGVVTPDGHNGKFEYDAYIKPQLAGGGVNEKISMNVITTPTSDVTVTLPV